MYKPFYNLRVRFAQCEMSQNEVARAAGMASSTMTARMTGAQPFDAWQIEKIAAALGISPEEYGKYMIRQSGRFEYDENLDAFYDYEKYGTERMNEEDGMFTDRGYVAYKGFFRMEEVMNSGQSSRMEMGGLSR